jgi:preprotein translocase subunit SecE
VKLRRPEVRLGVPRGPRFSICGQSLPRRIHPSGPRRDRKVHWPTRKETVATAIMVMIMTLLLAFFFFGVDAFFSTLVKFLLSLLG